MLTGPISQLRGRVPGQSVVQPRSSYVSLTPIRLKCLLEQTHILPRGNLAYLATALYRACRVQRNHPAFAQPAGEQGGCAKGGCVFTMALAAVNIGFYILLKD